MEFARQLDLFENESETLALRRDLRTSQEQITKLRKSMFARLGNFSHELLKCHNEIDELRSLIYNQKKAKKHGIIPIEPQQNFDFGRDYAQAHG